MEIFKQMSLAVGRASIHRGRARRRPHEWGHYKRTNRQAFTLPELLISMAILGMMSIALAGMSYAVQSAWDYTKNVETSELQSDAAMARIEYMLSQTGTYRLAGQPTQFGAAVVVRSVGTTSVPDVLVLWTGGRNGGLAAQGVLSRLPQVNELLIYTADSDNPRQLVEIAVPSNSAAIDFAGSTFATTITSLLVSSGIEKIPLCDRLRVTSLTSTGTTTTGSSYSGSSGSMTPPVTSGTTTSSQSVGAVRFQFVATPSDMELAAVSPMTAMWMSLSWPQGAVSSRSGLRQLTLQVELQVEPRANVVASGEVAAIPCFSSASVRYVYEK